MTKSTLHHDRDGLAIKALLKTLPTWWLYKNPANIFGGKEYSEDLIIEIVNNDPSRTVSGIEFGVQNKTNVKVRKNHVSTKLSISDIYRLRELQRPFLIHAYHIESDTSYWCWLSDWYEKNHRRVERLGRKQMKREISVEIPKRNVLDAKAVEQIRQHVTREHRKQKLRILSVEAGKLHAGDYNITVQENLSGMSTIIAPLHSDALFELRPLDEHSNAAFAYALETGEGVQIDGKVAIANVPESIRGLMDAVLTDSALQALLLPSVLEPKEQPLKIELLDGSSNAVFKSSFVLLQLAARGTKSERWAGLDTARKVEHGLVFDHSENSMSYSLGFVDSTAVPEILRERFELLARLQAVKRIRLTDLQTEQCVIHDLEAKPKQPPELVVRMVNALSDINEALNADLQLPKQFSSRDLVRAEVIAVALRTGAIKINPEGLLSRDQVLVSGDPAHIARTNLAHYLEHGSLNISLIGTTEEFSVDLIGTVLDLGPASYYLENVKISNPNELKHELAQPNIDDDTPVTTVFEIDQERVTIGLHNWPINRVSR